MKGDEILLESRITAMADVVERGSGTSYDTVVADACLRLFREQGFELPPH